MTWLRLVTILSIFWLSGAVEPAYAHPPTVLTDAAQKATSEEILAFRRQLADAIKANDAAKLRELYAPSFMHIHASGKVDARDARIVSALAGDPVIGTADVTELDIRIPNDWTAIASGLSPFTSRADGKRYAVRWMAVYVRTERSWVLAASQATRSPEIQK